MRDSSIAPLSLWTYYKITAPKFTIKNIAHLSDEKKGNYVPIAFTKDNYFRPNEKPEETIWYGSKFYFEYCKLWV